MITNRQTYYNKYSDVFFHYYEIDGCVWYSYHNITNMLNSNENFTEDFYNNILNENEKKIFEEEYEDFRHNTRIGKFQYINTSGLFKLLDAHAKVAGKIRKEVTRFEFDKGYIDKDDNNNHALQVNLGILGQCLNANDGDYEKLHQVASSVYNAPCIKQIENGNPIKEKVINEFRNDLYDYEDIEEVEYKITTVDESREKSLALYKKFKKAFPESSVPEWIIDVIK